MSWGLWLRIFGKKFFFKLVYGRLFVMVYIYVVNFFNFVVVWFVVVKDRIDWVNS